MVAAIELNIPSPVQKLATLEHAHPEYALWCKRDDLIHPVVSGNKWRKLSALLDAKPTLPRSITSFGGGYSNHLHALGYICQQANIPFTAVIRGHYGANPTAMLTDIAHWGATIEYTNKISFAQRKLHYAQGQTLCIPEGGFCQPALAGVTTIIDELMVQLGDLPKIIVLPVATGTTMAGLLYQIPQEWEVHGIAVLKDSCNRDEQNKNSYLANNVRRLLSPEQQKRVEGQWSIHHDYHFGGYAKSPPDLQSFIKNWSHYPIEAVYSAKGSFGLLQLLSKKILNNSKQIIYLHTGGLQGAR